MQPPVEIRNETALELRQPRSQGHFLYSNARIARSMLRSLRKSTTPESWPVYNCQMYALACEALLYLLPSAAASQDDEDDDECQAYPGHHHLMYVDDSCPHNPLIVRVPALIPELAEPPHLWKGKEAK